MSNNTSEITGDEELYGLLGVSFDATESEIRKAYRKSAIKYHPDKNPSKDAAEMFNSLLNALKILTTPDLKQKYDSLYQAAKEKKLKAEQLNSERRKLREELQVRENRAAMKAESKLNEKRRVESLKEEGFKRRKLKDETTVIQNEAKYTQVNGKSPLTVYTNTIDEKIAKIRQKISSM